MKDIREEMRARLPAFLQPLLTWVTGKAHRRQRPLFHHNSATQTLTALMSLFGGIALGTGLLNLGGPFLLGVPVCWLFIIGSARKIQVTLLHQCAHFNYSGSKKLDRLWGQTLSTLVFVDHFDSYYHEHIDLHHSKALGGETDPDCKFLLELGIAPGLDRQSLWQRLGAIVISPRFHFIFLRARIRANFVSATFARKSAALFYQISIFAGALYAGQLAAYFCVYVLPLTVGYHVAALLNFSSLHIWLKPPTEGEPAKSRMCSLTNGRFLGEMPPDSALPWLPRMIGWSKWWARMTFVHLPARIAVLSGDLPVHDYHHRYPMCRSWADYLYMRQKDIDSGLGPWRQPYTEVWGLFNCLDAVFVSLSRTPTLSPECSPSPNPKALVQI